MTRRPVLPLLLVLAVGGGVLASGSATPGALGPASTAQAASGPSGSVSPAPGAVLVAEQPCPSALGAPTRAAGRGLAGAGADSASTVRGAQLIRVCGAADALGAVTQAAVSGAQTVYGSGPHVRAALAQVAADRPGQRFVAVR